MPKVLWANPKPCLGFCPLTLNHATGIHVHFTLTSGFWLTKNLHFQNGFKPQTLRGYTWIIRLTTQLQVHNITNLSRTTTKQHRHDYTWDVWLIIQHARESVPETHTNLHFVIHHTLIFDVAPTTIFWCHLHCHVFIISGNQSFLQINLSIVGMASSNINSNMWP